MVKLKNVSLIVALTLLIVLIVVGYYVYTSGVTRDSKEEYSFNHLIEILMDEQRKGNVYDVSNDDFDRMLELRHVRMSVIDHPKEEDEEESSENEENFKWKRLGRNGRKWWRSGRHSHRYPGGCRFHRTRKHSNLGLITYPYYVQGPARWVKYEGDYFYVTY